MTAVLKTWTVDNGEGRIVTVDRLDDEVRVTWFCGATRTFTPALLKAALEHFDAVTAAGDGDVWYGDNDSPGARYFARLDGDALIAHEEMDDDARKVSWSEFRAALEAAIPKPRGRTRKA